MRSFAAPHLIMDDLDVEPGAFQRAAIGRLVNHVGVIAVVRQVADCFLIAIVTQPLHMRGKRLANSLVIVRTRISRPIHCATQIAVASDVRDDVPPMSQNALICMSGSAQQRARSCPMPVHPLAGERSKRPPKP